MNKFAAIEPMAGWHLDALYGAKKPGNTIRGYTILGPEGEPKVIFGLALAKGQHLLFLKGSEDVMNQKRSVGDRRIAAAACARVRKMIQGVRAPVRAMADQDYDGSAELLEHIGFERMPTTSREDLYQWPQPSPR